MENKAVLENRQYFNIVIGIYFPWTAAQVVVCVAYLIQVFAKNTGGNLAMFHGMFHGPVTCIPPIGIEAAKSLYVDARGSLAVDPSGRAFPRGRARGSSARALPEGGPHPCGTRASSGQAHDPPGRCAHSRT